MESRRAASYIEETARLARLALGPTGAPFEVPRHAFAAAARAREAAGVAAWDAPAPGGGLHDGPWVRAYPLPGPLYGAGLQPPAPPAGAGPSPVRLGAGAVPAGAEGPEYAGPAAPLPAVHFHRTSPPSPRAALGPRRTARLRASRPPSARSRPASRQQGPARAPPTREAIADLFHLPVPEAVRALGLGTTTFKRLCREAGIGRWPHRKLDALARWGARADAPRGLDRAALAAARRALLAAAARVRADPSASVTEPVLLVRKILGPHGL
eukprot:tig00021758_g23397.t1